MKFPYIAMFRDVVIGRSVEENVPAGSDTPNRPSSGEFKFVREKNRCLQHYCQSSNPIG